MTSPPAGLCGACRHALVRPTRRGTVYLRCGLAATDDRFPRYPTLPVLRCPGYQPGGVPGDEPGQRRPEQPLG